MVVCVTGEMLVVVVDITDVTGVCDAVLVLIGLRSPLQVFTDHKPIFDHLREFSIRMSSW